MNEEEIQWESVAQSKWLTYDSVLNLFYSDSDEERPADNKVDVSFPIQYDVGIVLSRWFYFLLP